MTKIRIVTHSAGFHADDVMGVATLMLMLGDENVEVIRSRDPEIIASGDYVLDVGGIYDPSTNRFDHHQRGGADVRENGIPYAAFGLVWKHYGAAVAGSSEVAERIDRMIVQPTDAVDNGVTLYGVTHPSKIRPFDLSSVLAVFGPSRGEDKTYDAGFSEAVEFAKSLLRREIIHAQANVISERVVREAYERASDKKLVIIEAEPAISRFLISSVLSQYPDTLFYIRKHEDALWQAVAVDEPDDHFMRRASFPESWAGKRDTELVAVTGVADAVFCHNGRFMVVAKSKESAMKLVELSLASKS